MGGALRVAERTKGQCSAPTELPLRNWILDDRHTLDWLLRFNIRINSYPGRMLPALPKATDTRTQPFDTCT